MKEAYIHRVKIYGIYYQKVKKKGPTGKNFGVFSIRYS